MSRVGNYLQCNQIILKIFGNEDIQEGILDGKESYCWISNIREIFEKNDDLLNRNLQNTFRGRMEIMEKKEI